MKNVYKPLISLVLVFGMAAGLFSCLNPLNFNQGESLITIDTNVTGSLDTNDVTSAILMLVNKSKTVEVTSVVITHPECEPGTHPNQPAIFNIANQPKALMKKAQYLAPCDKSYTIQISYYANGLGNTPAKTGGPITIEIPMPVPKQVYEIFIYRNIGGEVIISTEIRDPHPGDTGIPEDDPLEGEGTIPAIIPLHNRDRMASFIVVSMTRSQIIGSVKFDNGRTDDDRKEFRMDPIGPNEKQSIALSHGAWKTTLTYTRENVVNTLGPINSVIIPSNDPQAEKEHYLYFYLNDMGDYAVSKIWPPFPNDVDENDLLPLDKGKGRGMIKIINNSYAQIKNVTIKNQGETGYDDLLIDYRNFTPAIPIQYNKTGYVGVVGTETFPINPHQNYFIEILLENFDGTLVTLQYEKKYIKDQIITITINREAGGDFPVAANFKIENKVTTDWPVYIIGMRIVNKNKPQEFTHYYWDDTQNEAVSNGQTKTQLVESSNAMPIGQFDTFRAEIILFANEKKVIIHPPFGPANLYSTDPDTNLRTITVTNADIDDLYPDVGATVTIKNEIKTWPVYITGFKVYNKARPNESTSYLWDQPDWLDNGDDKVVLVSQSTAMPIEPGYEFEAVFYLRGNENTAEKTKQFNSSILYSITPSTNKRTIKFDDDDVPQALKTSGSLFTLENNITAYPVEIIGMKIQNKNNRAQATDYGKASWEPHVDITKGKTAQQLVMGSEGMPITQNAQFEAVITLSGGDVIKDITKEISPATLYSGSSPEANTRTIAIVNADIPQDILDGIANTRGAKLIVENKVTSWPVVITGITVRNKNSTNEYSKYDSTYFDPDKNDIAGRGTASVKVMTSPDMRIREGNKFEALFTVTVGGSEPVVISESKDLGELYTLEKTWEDNTKNITLENSDITPELIAAFNNSRGALFTIKNEIAANIPLKITKMRVYNTNREDQYLDFDFTTNDNVPIENGKKNEVEVRASAAMPITKDAKFKVRLWLEGSKIPFWANVSHNFSSTAVVEFSPAELYSDKPFDENTRTITITADDLPDGLKYAYSGGAIVTIKNDVKGTWPVIIEEIDIIRIQDDNNPASNKQNYDYNSFMQPGILYNGQSRPIKVISTPEFINDSTHPLFLVKPGDRFMAVLNVVSSSTNERATITKYFDNDPNIQSPAVLYTTGSIENNRRVITLSNGDIPEQLKPVNMQNIGTKGATVTIKNNVRNDWPVTVINMEVIKLNSSESTDYGMQITNGKEAKQKVVNTEDMPIESGDQFQAKLTLFGNGNYQVITKAFSPAGLYSTTPDTNTRTITIEDSDLNDDLKPPQNISAMVTVINEVPKTLWPLQIDKVVIQNKARPGENKTFSGANWSPGGSLGNGNNATFLVKSDAAMPIKDGETFEAVIYITGGGISETVTKTISPQLYPPNPATNNISSITIKLSDSDVRQKITAYANSKGVSIIIENKVRAEWPITIDCIKIFNSTATNGQTFYSNSWTPSGFITNNKTVTLTAMAQFPGFVIDPETKFTAYISMASNSGIATITKTFSPAELFSLLPPAQNVRTITITDYDIPEALKPTSDLTKTKTTIANAGIGATVVIDGREWIKVRTATYMGSNAPAVLLLYKGVLPEAKKWNTNSMKAGTFWNDELTTSHFYMNNFYHNKPTMVDVVNTWYMTLNSPILKQIHMDPGINVSFYNKVFVNFWNPDLYINGNANKSSWKSDTTGYIYTENNERNTILKKLGQDPDYTKVIAFIPYYRDIGILAKYNKLGASQNFWLRNTVTTFYDSGVSDFFWFRYRDYTETKHVVYVKPDGTLDIQQYSSLAYVRPCVWVSTD